MGLTVDDLPETVKIGPFDIKFKISPDLWLREGKWGYAHYRYAEIELAENIPPNRILAETIIHEVLHHIGDIYGAKDFKEEIVGRIDKGVLDFIVHNKELLLKLMEA